MQRPVWFGQEWPRTRLIACAIAIAVVIGALLRIALTAVSGASAKSVLFDVAYGAVADLAVALVLLAPLGTALALVPDRLLARPWFRHGLLAAIATATVFEAFVEFFFFEEFNSRFNNIAVDYVLFPGEVVGNVFESYDVPFWIGLSVALGLLAARAVAPWHRNLAVRQRTVRQRLGALGGVAGSATLALALLLALPRESSANRVESELAASGPLQLFRAFWTAELDYPLYYRTLPQAEARERAARVLGFPELSAERASASAADFALARHVGGAPDAGRRSQVVVILEESLGSDFVAPLGGQRRWTPELERHMPEGLVVRNLVANGNRTVRGLEGVLCSFVPLPGDSIVKRPRSEGVATLATVFAAHGYRTAFFYGGYGVFDHMKPFALGAGYEEFVEQSDLPADAFRTIWGVADEYIFDALLDRQVRQRERGEPFFATLLSVSNHKPYRVPAGRIDWPADKPCREAAVRYADWCIGRYLDGLRARGLERDTLVLVVGDHGARVYGSEEIPTESYRIPAVFFGTDPALRGAALERLCSQIDLAPTLVELAGLEADVPFLGASLLGLPADGGRAFVHHNRDVGILTDDSLVVLQLQKQVAYYVRSGRASQAFRRVEPERASERLRGLADDAAAVFGTAYELYENGRLGLPPQRANAGALPVGEPR